MEEAYDQLDQIFSYVAKVLKEPQIADNLLDELEKGIYSLDTFPEKGSLRKVGVYANSGYRQLFVKNYTIIYRIDHTIDTVYVVAVVYSRSQY